MGVFKNLKAMKEAMAAGMSGQGPSEEALASLTPEQRAAYDAQIARPTAAQAQTFAADAKLDSERSGSHALRGPAGEYVHGAAATRLAPEQVAAMSPAEQLAWTTQQSKDQFKDVLRNPFGRAKPPAPPVQPSAHPVDRDAQIATERAARDAARAPYLAPQRAPVSFARLATRGKTQAAEVAAYLASSGLAARPDLVYGVYRVPDRISPTTIGSEQGRVVEWDIVHAATFALNPASTPAHAVYFDGAEQWVARRSGEPSVLDEDLVLHYLARAGIGPEHCLGIARHLLINSTGGGDGQQSATLSQVTGVYAFHPAGLGAGVVEQMTGQRPLPLPAGPPPGIHVAVLNWRDIARAIHPQTQRPFAVPSPFPHLPSTPQELVRAYLEVVGVAPADCYCAQVTEDKARDIQGSGSALGGLVTYASNRGDEQPCADGKDRRRLAGGSRVIVGYRDRADYGAGRERWSAYERDVLQASLANGTGARRPVEKLAFIDGAGVGRKLLRAAERVADFVDDDSNRSPFDDIAPHRYCWPPVPAA